MKKYKKTFIFCKKTEEIKVFQRLFFLPGAFTDEIGINGKITVMPFFCDLTVCDGSGNGASAEPHTIEVPYAARREALELLERALYQDYMALDMDALTGGSLTNVAIRAATANLNLKADRYEWQVRQFMESLLALLGIATQDVRFKRQTIANESETVADIAAMRQDIDQRTALRLNPYIQDEEVEALTASAADE